MSMNYCIIGGDSRSFFLAKLLSKEKNEVKIYGFEKLENIKKDTDPNQMIADSDIIVLPLPFTRDNITVNMPYCNQVINIEELIHYLKNKTIIVGNINEEIKEKLLNKNNKVIDIMKKEEFAILNGIPTAEATIEIILKNTKKVIQGMNCLVMGFGRIGKILAHKLQGLSINVTCMVTNEIENAWATVYGYDTIKIENIKNDGSKFKQYDIIINTIPKIIFKEELRNIKKETLVIDLAGKPYGIDRNIVEEEKINFIEALGLPRKICTSNISKIYKRNYKTIYLNI